MNRGRGSNRGGGGHYASRGRSPRSADHYVARHVPVGSGARSAGPSSGSGSSEGGRRNPEATSIDGVTKEFDRLLSSDYPRGPNSEPRGVGNFKVVQSATEAEPTTPLNISSVSPCYDNYCPSSSTPSEQNAGSPIIIESYSSSTPHVNATPKKKEPSQSTGGQFHNEVQSGKTGSEGTTARNELENSDSLNKEFSFDICEERNKSVPKLHVKNKAMRDEKKRLNQGDNIQVLRPGMILLKGYISLMDQVKLIKSCQNLGRGPGGFYQPGYRDGAKLHLKMMCLGKNWDPETCSYGEIRPVDQAKPPPIPNDFQQLVKGAIQKCHAHMESDSKLKNAKNGLPSMSPNICIINFYTHTGKLGLHQDKDESEESLRKGLPVVSLSLGDSAEFLFGDQRDIDKADKVVLESGDVLIFGGESRHIFHGVSSIKPGTAPKPLLEETDLRPGRLNLTFKEDGFGARSAGPSSGSGSSEGGRRNPEATSIDGVTKEFDRLLSSDYPCGPNSEPCGVGNFKVVQSASEAEPTTPLNVPYVSPCYDNYCPSSFWINQAAVHSATSKVAATYVSQKARSKGRLFHTCSDSISGRGCSFFVWADELEVAGQGMFPGMMRRIDSLVSENLDLATKLNVATQGERNTTVMVEEMKNEMKRMIEEISQLKQLKLILCVVIIFSWAPTIFKCMA